MFSFPCVGSTEGLDGGVFVQPYLVISGVFFFFFYVCALELGDSFQVNSHAEEEKVSGGI